MDPATVLAVGKIVGGLFGGKKSQKTNSPAENLVSQAKGARWAAKEYGFNPLTMLQFGQTGGSMASGGGAPPLASIDLITSGLHDLNDVVSGDAARRRAADELELDLARVKLDQLRSGVISVPVNAADNIGSAPAAFGRRAGSVAVPSGTVHTRPFSMGENPIAPGRKTDVDPVTNTSGVIEIENALTPLGPITIPGDGGEPWGVDEQLGVALSGTHQVAGQWLEVGRRALRKKFPKHEENRPWWQDKPTWPDFLRRSRKSSSERKN